MFHKIASLPLGAQFYPHCVQIRVTRGGTSELPKGIALPGAYDPEDEESVSLPPSEFLMTTLLTCGQILVREYEISSGQRGYTAPGGPVWSEAVPNKNRDA